MARYHKRLENHVERDCIPVSLGGKLSCLLYSHATRDFKHLENSIGLIYIKTLQLSGRKLPDTALLFAKRTQLLYLRYNKVQNMFISEFSVVSTISYQYNSSSCIFV